MAAPQPSSTVLTKPAQAIAGGIASRRARGSALNSLGNRHAARGEPYRAIACYHQALEIARETGDRGGEEITLGNLGNRYTALGEPRRAIAFYEQALVIAREIGDSRGAGDALAGLSHAYTELREPRRAMELYEQALGVARELGDRRSQDRRRAHRTAARARLGRAGGRRPVSRRAVSTWRRYPREMAAAAALVLAAGIASIIGLAGGAPESTLVAENADPAVQVAIRTTSKPASLGAPSRRSSDPVTGLRNRRETVSQSLIAAPVSTSSGPEHDDTGSRFGRESGVPRDFAALVQPVSPAREAPPAPPPAPSQDPAALSAGRSTNEIQDRLPVPVLELSESDFPARSGGEAAVRRQPFHVDPDRRTAAVERAPRVVPGDVQANRTRLVRSNLLYGASDHFVRRARPSGEASGSDGHAGRSPAETQLAALGSADVPLARSATTRGVLTAQSQQQPLSPSGQDEASEPEDDSRLSDEPSPFLGEGDIPDRAPLLLEIGDPFLDTGELDVGFELPTGAVWQPRLWVFGTQRTSLQTIDTGDEERISEWVNRLDLFANLQLTGTEKILAGIRPLDENQPDDFSGYRFEPSIDKDFNNNLNVDIRTLFAEGDFGSLLPNLDPEGQTLLDFGFTVGRQPLIFQDGILISDTQDTVGLVRNNIRLPGVSNLRVAGVYSSDVFDETTRSAGGIPIVEDENLQLTGLFTEWDTPYTTINADAIYAWDDTEPDGDGIYAGISAAQRLGELNTTFRVNGSLAEGEESVLVRDGILVSSELSWTPYATNDTLYFNPFVAFGEFLQAAREEIDGGGPLAPLGILFASPNIGEFGSELSNRANDVVGAALGYQAFWDDNRRNLAVEVAARHDLGLDDGAQIVTPEGLILSFDGFDQYGAGFQFQQAIGQRAIIQLEGFGALQEDRNDTYGGRLEFLYQF